MKKNLGSTLVKKAIVMAMSAMLISTTPIMGVNAVEAGVSVVDAAQVLDSDEDSSQEDAALKEAIAKEQSAFISNIVNGVAENTDTIINGVTDIASNQANDPNGKGNAYNVIDDEEKLAADTVISEVNEAIDEEVKGVNNAVDTVDSAAADTEKLNSELDKYNEKTDELLNKDSDIVASVEDNIENNNIVTNITASGDIMLDVKDSDGNNVNVVDYTEEKANTAASAAEDAQESVDKILHSPDANIAEEHAKIDAALATAIAARDDAESAYNAANAVLIEEIKRYNAYVQKYYPEKELYVYTDATGKTSTPVYTDEELANFTSDLTMSEGQISEANENSTVDLAAQENKIIAAGSVVSGCKNVVDATKNAVVEIKKADDNLVECLDNVKALAENALEKLKDVDTSDSDKAFYQDLYDKASALIDEYKYQADDEFNKPLDQTHPDADIQDSYHARLDYAADSVYDLADMVDQKWAEANDALYNENDGAIIRYQQAKARYNELKAQYEAKKNAVGTNFVLLEEKLKAAEKQVITAYNNLEVCITKVNEIQEIKDNLESAGGSDTTPDDGSNTTPDDGSNTTTNDTVTLDDDATPLAGALADTQIVDEATPLADGLTTIDDAQTALLDSVPKTGDTSASAIPFALGSFAAFAGAIAARFRRKTDR